MYVGLVQFMFSLLWLFIFQISAMSISIHNNASIQSGLMNWVWPCLKLILIMLCN